MVSLTYEHLARLSIFVDVARYGELTAHHDNHHTHFEELFHRLEANATGGLYTLMCGLTQLFRHLPDRLPHAELLEEGVVDSIRAVQVHRPQRHAHRHIRDYVVASSIRRVAQQLVLDVRQLIQQHRR